MLTGKKSARRKSIGSGLAKEPVRRDSAVLRGSSSRLYRPLSGRCLDCEGFSEQSQRACQRCIFEDGGLISLKARGRLESFVIIRQALPGYRGALPYAIGAIALTEGIKLRAVVGGCHPEDLRAGMEVELGLVKICEDNLGREVVAQAFRPV